MALNNPYALSFDGVDDYASHSADPALNAQEHTIEFWIKPSMVSAYRSIFCLTSTSSSYPAVLVRIVDGKIQYYMRSDISSSSAVSVESNVSLVEGGIYHVATVYTGTQMQIYLNGALDKSLSSSHAVFANTGMYLGRFLNQYYAGVLDEFRFWNYARTQDQIQTNMHKTLSGTEAGLALYYRCDAGAGTILVDSSPNGLDATIYGATWVPGLVDLEDLTPPGRVDISAILRGLSRASVKADRIRGLSAHLTGAATATNVRMNLIAALKARLQGKATIKSNVLVLFIPEGVYVIDADEIFAKNQPSRGQVVANYIEVWVNPLKPVTTAEEVYRSKDPITIPAGETKTVTVHFDDEPVTEPAVVLEETGANLSIIDTKYYAWGADVTIKNAGVAEQTCLIVASGKPLKVQGREVVVKKDEVSIQENGLKKYTFDNPFVQDRATAELIADKLLSYANVKRDIEIDWRGDPALELADVTMIPEYQRRGLDQRGIFYITKQELEFDGGLQAKLEGRKM